MAINYSPSSYVLPSLGATDSLVANVNGLGPTSSQTAPVGETQAGTGTGLYGMTSTATTGAFNTSYNQATAGYAPFPDSGTQGDINQLQSVYNGIPAAYDVSGTVNAMNAARQQSLTTGTQAANNAASQYQQAQGPGQYAGAGASVLRAQALLPYMNADTQSAQSEGQYSDTARQAALQQSASVADQIATLQQNYTNSLAAYNSGRASFGLNYANDQTGLALQASTASTQAQLSQQAQLAQLNEQAREANLSAALNQSNTQAQAQQTATNQQLSAAAALAATKAPTGEWTTSPTGQVLSGQSTYNAYNNYLANNANVASTLAKIA